MKVEIEIKKVINIDGAVEWQACASIRGKVAACATYPTKAAAEQAAMERLFLKLQGEQDVFKIVELDPVTGDYVETV